MAHRRICVFTGTRAEYGLLRGVLERLQDSPRVELQLLVSGTHLSPAFGETWREIVADGFTIDARAEMLVSGDTPTATATSLGLGVMQVAGCLERLAPNLLLVLGDRYEALAAAQAAMVLRIPIAHVHGGESTEGLIDEAIRHAITKLAHVHFTAAAAFRRRVLQLGEDPARVFEVGAPGVDHVLELDPVPKEELASEVGLDAARPWILVTYHPVTLEVGSAAPALEQLLAALRSFPEHAVLITGVNADPEGLGLVELLEAFQAEAPDRVRLVRSLGHRRYLSALRAAAVVVGNSSSGIIEAPAAGTPTVNLGDRQRGRPRAPSVLDVPEEAGAIREGIHAALGEEWQRRAAERRTPYGSGGASRRIVEVLERVELEGILKKRFHDLGGA